MKLIIERTISSKNEKVYLTLLDMSKAFDSIIRNTLINDLKTIINTDEIHLLKILLDVKLAVKCGDHITEFFNTDTGAPQGDCASANQFTLYLAKSLQNTTNQITVQDHSYHQKTIQTQQPYELLEHN